MVRKLYDTGTSMNREINEIVKQTEVGRPIYTIFLKKQMKNQMSFLMFNDYSVVVSLGHQTITVIPVLDGKPDAHNARRINLGEL